MVLQHQIITVCAVQCEGSCVSGSCLVMENLSLSCSEGIQWNDLEICEMNGMYSKVEGLKKWRLKV